MSIVLSPSATWLAVVFLKSRFFILARANILHHDLLQTCQTFDSIVGVLVVDDSQLPTKNLARFGGSSEGQCNVELEIPAA